MAVILGDSNVVKYLPLLKEKKSDPSLQATTVSRATNVVLLQDLLSNPKAVHALVIISAMTNIITSKYFDDYDLMIDHCRNAFTDVLLWLQEGREALSGFAETVSAYIGLQRPFIVFRLNPIYVYVIVVLGGISADIDMELYSVKSMPHISSHLILP